MNNPERLPPNRVYEEGVKVGTSLIDRLDKPSTISNEINWDQEINTSDQVRRATGIAATQFHYANVSHLMLCGKILYHETKNTPLDAKKLAVSLCNYKLEDIDIWGNYLREIEAAYSVSQPMRHYYIKLFSEEQTLPLVIGMETLAGPVAHSIYNELQHVGDDLFQQITSLMVQQKSEEQELVTEYLSDAINSLSEDEKERMAQISSQYREMVMPILSDHREELTELNLDAKQLMHKIRNEVEQFHQDIHVL